MIISLNLLTYLPQLESHIESKKVINQLICDEAFWQRNQRLQKPVNLLRSEKDLSKVLPFYLAELLT